MKANLGRLGICAFLTCLMGDSFSWCAPFSHELILTNPDQSFYPSAAVSDIDGNRIVVGRNSVDANKIVSGAIYDALSGVKLRDLRPLDAYERSGFGWSAAISGNIAILGDYLKDAGSFRFNSGTAYLFDVTTGTQLFQIFPVDPEGGKLFGASVSISGNIAIVGAHGDNGTTGAAYLFDIHTGGQLFKLTAADAAPGDFFGKSVGISGDRAIVGSYQDDDRGENSGSAYVFDVTTGAQLAKLTASDGARGDSFGYSVDIDGDTAIVGAHFNRYQGIRSGSAYLFDVNSGSQLHKLLSSDLERSDEFGFDVAISGNLAVVGAIRENSQGANSGAAYAFNVRSGNEVVKLLKSNPAPALRYFGGDVAISGKTILVGGYVYTPEPSSVTYVIVASLCLICGRGSKAMREDD